MLSAYYFSAAVPVNATFCVSKYPERGQLSLIPEIPLNMSAGDKASPRRNIGVVKRRLNRNKNAIAHSRASRKQNAVHIFFTLYTPEN